MNARARMLRAVVCAAALSAMLFPSIAQTSSRGSTFTLNHAIHLDVLTLPNYITDPVGPGLANSVRLFTVDQHRCNYTDHTVCLNFLTTYLGTFGSSGDGLLDINQAEAESLLIATQETIPIRVVRSLFLGGSFKGGVTSEGYFDALIAYDYPYTVYAHEFGHMCGLPARTDCTDALMWDETDGAHDNLTSSEVTLINQKFSLCCVETGTADCAATGVAWVEDATAISGSGGVSITFGTVWEVNTQSFEVKRVNPATSAFLYSLGRPALTPSGDGKRYSIVDQNGVAGAVYQIIEHQRSGFGDLVNSSVTAGPAPASMTSPQYNADSLAAIVAAYSDGTEMQFRPNPCTNQFGSLRHTPEYEILCPDSLVSVMDSYANLWRNRNVGVGVINKTMADTCAGGYAGWIRRAAGTKYFLLVGDANDHVMWDDSTRWSGGWEYPGCYDLVNDSTVEYVCHLPSQPSKDIVPTFYTPVTNPPDHAWTAWTPYFASDLPYSDVDGDSLPDVIVGRLPVSSVADIQAYTQKLNTWLSSTNGSIGSDAALLTFAVNHGVVPAWPTAFAEDSLSKAFPTSVHLTRAGYVNLSRRGYGQNDSIIAIANAAASGGADVIVWNLNSSDRYENTGFWRIRANTDPLPIGTTNRPFISVGLSCGMNNFDETEVYDARFCVREYPPCRFALPRRPLVERLLFDHPGKGAIAQVAPTRGSYIEGNPLFGQEFLRRLYMAGNSIGSAFLYAQRICIERYPNYRDLFKSYVLLGDPRLGPNVVTGVASRPDTSLRTRLLRPEPNPFNPSARLRFYLNHPTRISITIYDVQGRMVKHLLKDDLRPMGWGSVRWNGDTESGSAAGSGVYFAQLRAEGMSLVQRLVLLR